MEFVVVENSHVCFIKLSQKNTSVGNLQIFFPLSNKQYNSYTSSYSLQMHKSYSMNQKFAHIFAAVNMVQNTYTCIKKWEVMYKICIFTRELHICRIFSHSIFYIFLHTHTYNCLNVPLRITNAVLLFTNDKFCVVRGTF